MQQRSPIVPLPILIAVVGTFALIGPGSPPALGQTPPPPCAAIMPLDEVRIGMTGYGLTVFAGTKIEPFALEVVSITTDTFGASPKRSVVWIRCTEPRLLKTGPIQGMSGSPIYLWEQDEPKILGEGGRLVGAFAYGYSMAKDCFAGVQPIELMRQVGDRARNPPPQQQAGTAPTAGLATVSRLQRIASARNVPVGKRLRLDCIQSLLEKSAEKLGIPIRAADALAGARLPGARSASQVRRMLLPMSVGSADTAALVAPLLKPMGIAAVANGSGLTGATPPPGIDAENTRLEPGSVLTIPLIFGDMVMAPSGTVTEVRADGTVLAFGHQFYAEGAVALPMATGYCHFVVPRIDLSFRPTGTLRVLGSIVQDEYSAVAGVAEQRFVTAPIEINVRMPGQPPQQYHYRVVDHPTLTPILAALTPMFSVSADQEMPIENTLHLHGQLSFTAQRTITIDSLIPGASRGDLLFELLPVIAIMMQNPHERLKFEQMRLSADVEPVYRAGSMVNARLDRVEVAPGDSLGVTIQVRPYQKPPHIYRTTIEIPSNIPEGDYQLAVTNASSYARLLMATRPHLFATETIDDLVQMTQMLLSIRRNAIYVVLTWPDQGLSVGRDELPRLPSSRRAMIATPTNTLALPFADTVERVVDTDVVIDGDFTFTINVRK